MSEWAQFRIDASKHIARKSGQSAVAAAAYRAGERLADERTGEVHDYTRRYGVAHAEMVMPETGGPAWTREQLWNAAEAAERRKDARTARKVEMALPEAMTDEQRLVLARAWAHEIANRYGVAVDFAIHRPDREGDQRNHHMHMLMTTRKVSREGLGEKAHLELSNADQKKRGLSVGDVAIRELRQTVADRFNRECVQMGVALSADPRSYADRGIDIEPTKHVGVHASAMARKGKQAERVTEHEAVRQANADRIRQRPEVALERLATQRGGFTPTDIAKELNRYIDDPQEFQNLLARVKASPEIVQVAEEQRGPDGRVQREARFATRDREQRAQRAEQRARDAAELRRRWEASREAFFAERRRAKPVEDADRKARYRAITETARNARAAARGAGLNAAELKARQSMIAFQAVQAREQLRAELAARRPKLPKWQDWVRDRAEEGDAAAIRKVRGWAYRDKRIARQMAKQEAEAARLGMVASPDRRRADPAAPGELRALPGNAAARMVGTVDRRTGDTTYQDSQRVAFVDRGRHHDHGDAVEADAIEVSLRLAAQKFGPKLDVQGTEEFRRTAVEVAVRRGMTIQFKDADMQRQADELRQQLAAERAARAKARGYTDWTATPAGGREPARQGEQERPQLPPALARQLATENAARKQLAAAGQPAAVQEKVIASMRTKITTEHLAEIYRETRAADPETRKLAASLHPELVKALASDAYARAFARKEVPEAGREQYIADRRAETEKRLAQGLPLPEIRMRTQDHDRNQDHDQGHAR
jgi:hypothetical protein